MTRRPKKIRSFSSIVFLLSVLSCGGGTTPVEESAESDAELHGTELVVGSTLDEIGILVLDAGGGPATWRPLRDVRDAPWKSAVELPAFDEAHVAGPGSVVLRAEDGDVSRFEPATGTVTRIERLESDDAKWVPSDQGGAFVDPASGEILAVLADRAWRYEVEGEIEWAGAVHDGIAVLLPGPELWLISEGAEEPAARGPVSVRTPGLITAWGRRLAFVDEYDDRSLRLLSIDPPESVGEVRLDGRITALSGSPSTHQIYVGLADPPGIGVVNRFSFTFERLTRTERPPLALRPSLFGEYLLVGDGEGIVRVDLTDGKTIPIAGSWEENLPIGLPDGRVLTRNGDGVVLVGRDGRVEDEPLTAPAGAAWVPIRWTPLAPVSADEIPEQPLQTSPGRAAAPEGQEAGPSDAPAAAPVEAAARPESGVPAGFYAIVGSARQRDGIEALVADLQTGGFPVQVQTTSDEAGETWYRGLVGPFASRAEAEAASRQLQRERQLQSWVMGVEEDG
ncbi:MAG: SPOR domain-containing protein [Gemmatimonadota bacterium]